MRSVTLSPLAILSAVFLSRPSFAQYTATYNPYNLPADTESDQYGTNCCGTVSSPESLCQNVFINSVNDFCLWAPPTDKGNSSIGVTEALVVAWCLKDGYGTRLIPDGTIHGAHFVQTPDYVQITGFGDFTKMNIPSGDEGGELDPHGADGSGNPKGGLVFGDSYGTMQQYHEWTSFMSDNQYCFRACKDGPDAPTTCNHVYDTMGCYWNMPGNYDSGTFTDCKADSDEPMGVYGTSTWNPNLQHMIGASTPDAHRAGPSSECTSFSTVSILPAALGTPTSVCATSSAAAKRTLSRGSSTTTVTTTKRSEHDDDASSARKTTSTSKSSTGRASTPSFTPVFTSPTPSLMVLPVISPATTPLDVLPGTAPSPTTTINAAGRTRPTPGLSGGALLPAVVALGAIVGGFLV